MIIKPIKTRIFNKDEDLITFISKHIKEIKEESVLVVTSKIVALSQGRVLEKTTIRTKDELIKKESEIAIPTKHVWLTVKDGMLLPSAGIDESNADGKLILLPKDSYKIAALLVRKLKRIYKLKKLGILITDSRTYPLRAGVTGVALGYAGFAGIRDYVGSKDIFGRDFKFSRTNVADCLASGAVLVMGEGNEQHPLALIEKAPIKFTQKINKKELLIPLEDDMYFPLLKNSLGN